MAVVNEEALRRAFVFPERALALVPWADPASEDDRRVLIEAEHPELEDALDRDPPELVLHGRLVNAALHVAMHQVVATQLWDDTPPQMWAAAARLSGLGYCRHDVLHMLIGVVSGEVYGLLQGQTAYDDVELERALAGLPESWHELADELPAPLAGNRQERRAAKRRRR